MSSPDNREIELIDSKVAVVRDQINKGEHGKASKQIKELIKQHPKDAELHILLGFTQIALRNPVMAVKAMQEGYRLAPSTANGLNLSSAYIEAGQFDPARKLLRGLIAKMENDTGVDAYPTPERLYHNMGLIHFREKRYKQAEEAFRRALEQEPTYHLSQFLLAKIYDATNRRALARQTYTKILEICPDCFDPMQALTMSYLKDGQFDMANLTVSNFLRISPIPEQELNRAKDLKRLVLRQSPQNSRKGLNNSAARSLSQPQLRQ